MLASLPLRLLLSPVLIAQALNVRRSAQLLPEPEGPRAGRTGQGPELRLLIAGDSSAAGVGVAHQSQALSGQLVAELAKDFTVIWQLEAKTGVTTAQTLAHLQTLPPARFDVAVTALGVNDVTRQVGLQRWWADQQAITALLAVKFHVQVQWRSGVPPLERFPLLPRPLRDVLGAQASAYNAALAQDSGGIARNLPFDASRLAPEMMASDGFHPGATVYAAWAEALAQEIRAEFAPRLAGPPVS
ncbi:SGNH/GDSL hydrolase family protein [Pararhodobacter oceanensis]|uniref:SGNH/GDSL hydrolase family protein n=1 Tax=Pararhodobacter oceanensis TaxID=2172121 RepID=UPI003A90D3CC